MLSGWPTDVEAGCRLGRDLSFKYTGVLELAEAIMAQSAPEVTPLDYTRYDFKDPETYRLRIAKGLTREVVEQISKFKNEPDWMLDYRLRAYEHFVQRPMPDWGPSLDEIDFDSYTYYANPMLEGETKKSWDDLPADIKNTFEKLGIPKAEREYFGGVGAQYDSGTMYHKLREDLAAQGIIFCDTDTAVKEHPDIVQKYFGKIVPYNDNKFSALNSAVWSGGSFVYIPPGGRLPDPAPGVLPDQREECGPVRADADHRRQGSESPLCRRMHCTGLLDRLAPRCGRGGRRQSRTRRSGTRPSRTGRRTSTTWSPSGRSPTRTRSSNGSTGTWAPR